MNSIKNYIFDFGGVLYDINIANAISNFNKLSDNSKILNENNLDVLINNNCVDRYEKGMIEDTQFIDCISNEMNLSCNKDEFTAAWNSILLGVNPLAEKVLKKVSENGNLSLLSNTSPMHYRKFEPECRHLFSMFDSLFLTFEIGLRKPNIEVFNYVLNKTQYKKEETLFIDDSVQNIEVAQKIGLNVHHLKGIDLLSELLHTV